MFQYPYGDSQQLNLDWLMEQWQETKASIDGSLQGEIDRVEAAITDLLTARDQAVAAQTAAEIAANAASGYAGTASTAASTATAQAAAAAASAALAGNHASNAQTSETNAGLQATAAGNSASAAAVSEGNARNSELAAAASSSAAAGNALYAEGMAKGTQNGTPVTSGSPYYENNAAYWAGEAQAYDNDAAAAAYYAEAMAKGTMDGIPVTSDQPGYEDNSKYYKDQAAAQAAAAAASAASADGTNAQKMIAAPEEASSTASVAHATGTYFRYNSKLYKATQGIAIGDTITPNTNCIEDTVGAELTELSTVITQLSGLIKLIKASNEVYTFPAETGTRTVFFSNVQLEAGTYYFRYRQQNSMASNVRNTPYLYSTTPTTYIYQRVAENWKLEAGTYEWKLTVTTAGTYDICFWIASPDVETTITDIYFYQIDRVYETRESIAYINDGYKADHSYSKNDLFYMFNKLYIATIYIADGAYITIGTNCRETTIRELLKTLLPA